MAEIPLIDIRPDHWAIVCDILQKQVPQYVVWAFGSRAKWTAKEYSDLDLCVVSDQPLSFLVLAALADDFSESDLPWKVDVVDWATTSESFRKIIERDKVVVQKAGRGVMAGDLINGEIPDHWEFTTLGDVCRRGGGNIQTGPFGSQLHASDYVSVGVPSIMPTNIGANRIVEDGIVRITEDDANRLGQHRLRAGDIVYSRRGDVEKRALIREREEGWLCGTGCLKIRLGAGVADPLFASLFLGHPAIREWIVRHAVGATMPNLNTSIMSAVPFALPPLAEQKAIAAVLGALDDKIELNRRMNATLEAMARTLFQSWFVDFDPVRAKMEGRQPPGLAPEVAALFPDVLNEDGKPQGWNNGSLGDLAVLNPESWSKKNAPAEIEYVDLANTKWGTIESTTRFAWADAPSRAQRILRPGDTIVGTVRPGNGSYSYVSADGLTGSTGFAILRPKDDQIRELLYLAATSSENIGRLSHLADGGAYPAVRPEMVLASPTVLPSSGLVAAFSGVVAPLINAIEQNKHESRTLATLRDTLLPKLLSGELRVANLESKLESVL